ncbi:undecaprenyl-diphosphate phosphatase [Candidatus Woesearchaeota archaeon]|nr:undecaprenyl-diphosphate phosphatase [Candidatus Woesearchaeota archaeon]
MVELIHALILGLIQGLTEWLPVSSSGHLAMAQLFFGLKLPVAFDVMLHLSTVLVVVLFFRRDIIKMLRSVARLDFSSEHGRLAVCVIIGSIPTAVIGFFFHDLFKSFFYSFSSLALAFIFTGVILFVSNKNLGKKALGFRDSFIIGIAQGVAIIPGVSRSGMTISVGMMKGLDRKSVARFSFLLSIPAVLGAAVFESGDLAFSGISLSSLIVAMIVSFFVGWFSLKLLLRVIMVKKFHMFAYYCLALGLSLLVFIGS